MTAALDRVTAALGNSNVRAFLHVIREGETDQTDGAYTLENGGAHFAAPPWVHPYEGQSAPPGKSSGAYQFIPHTWAGCSAALGLGGDFSPANQDAAAVYLIEGRGALDAVMAGDLVLACSKLRDEWVSLPGLGLERVQRVFQAFGGTSEAAGVSPMSTPATPPPSDAAATPQQEEPMPLLAALLPTVLQMFAPRVQAQLSQITGQPADQLGPFLADLFGKISAVTGQQNPVQAVATLQTAPPEAVKLVESHALDYLDKIAPLLDKLAAADAAENAAAIARMDAASARAARDKWDMTPWLVWIAGGTATVLVLALLGAIIMQALTGEKKIDTALIGLAGPLLAIAMGVWREIFAYRFDGNPASNATAALRDSIAAAEKKA